MVVDDSKDDLDFASGCPKSSRKLCTCRLMMGEGFNGPCMLNSSNQSRPMTWGQKYWWWAFRNK